MHAKQYHLYLIYFSAGSFMQQSVYPQAQGIF